LQIVIDFSYDRFKIKTFLLLTGTNGTEMGFRIIII
jgi:hypothetical protein